MKVVVKRFDELTTSELYKILKARAEIFIVEQKINCQDMDDIDYRSWHFFIENENGEIIAYLRAYYKDENEKVIKVGRVLTISHGLGHGRYLMEKAILFIKEEIKASKIYVAAQVQAKGFYEKMGFNVVSGEFLEEGIPHISMELYF